MTATYELLEESWTTSIGSSSRFDRRLARHQAHCCPVCLDRIATSVITKAGQEPQCRLVC